MDRPRRRLFVAILALALLAGHQGPVAAQSPSGQATLTAPGLSQPVEIRRDRWGINHIYAKTEDDLFFAQGYAAAKDRLFQFEVWRRRATGTVAEILGPRELKRDLGARLHRFRGNLDAELNHYHPRGEQIVEAYVRGVNAYIDEAMASPATLPIEFRMLGITPGKWTPAVVVSRHQALTANVTNEAAYVRGIAALGSARKLRDLLYFQGGEPVFALDPLIDPATFPANVLELYDAFRDPIQFRPEDIVPEFRGTTSTARQQAAALGEADRRSPASFDETHDAPPRLIDTSIGSNNWVISGARSQSTYPILANDPHRVIEAPSLRYWVHLVGPGWNVIGGGEPVLPGVSIGHNEHGAWGLTVFGSDNEDLYAYETNPANPNEYRFEGRWEAMRIETDTIPVEGQAAEKVQLKFTRHGPVLFEDTAHHRAYVVRAAWLEPGTAPYLASLRMNQATSWQEFRDACAYNRMPSENMVWVDKSGAFGWQAAGITPLRRGWSGLLPVAGDGRFEWGGYLPITALPSESSPARGFIATANHYLFPNDYPYPEARHFVWADPYRAHRIEEVLGSGRRFNVAEVVRLQNDDLSIPARQLVPLLRDLPFADAAAARARDALIGWDFVLDKDSVPAGIYAMFSRQLFLHVREAAIPAAARRAVPLNTVQVKTIIDWLYAPDARFGADPVKGRDLIVQRSLEEAVAELTRRFGADPAGWKYGQPAFHHALVKHPLSGAVNDATRQKLDVGPLPRGGDGATVSATGFGDNQTAGGSFKIVADAEDWDTAVGLNTPGQSGNPDDPHYRDLFDLWARGRYFPVAYSRPKVESVTESITTLTPK